MCTRHVLRRRMPRLSILILMSVIGVGCASQQIVHIPPTRAGAPYSRAVRVKPPRPDRAGIFQRQSVVTVGAIAGGSADMTAPNRSSSQQMTRI